MFFSLDALADALNEHVDRVHVGDLASTLSAHRGQSGRRVSHDEAGVLTAAAMFRVSGLDATSALSGLVLTGVTVPVADGPAVLIEPADVALHPLRDLVPPTFGEAVGRLLFAGGARTDIIPSQTEITSVEVWEQDGRRCAFVQLLAGSCMAIASYGRAITHTRAARKTDVPAAALIRAGAAAYALTPADPEPAPESAAAFEARPEVVH